MPSCVSLQYLPRHVKTLSLQQYPAPRQLLSACLPSLPPPLKCSPPARRGPYEMSLNFSTRNILVTVCNDSMSHGQKWRMLQESMPAACRRPPTLHAFKLDAPSPAVYMPRRRGPRGPRRLGMYTAVQPRRLALDTSLDEHIRAPSTCIGSDHTGRESARERFFARPSSVRPGRVGFSRGASQAGSGHTVGCTHRSSINVHRL